MLAHIREQTSDAKTFLEKEEQSFRALFSFLKRMPYFLRILNEAEILAPKAHRQHFRNITAGYLRFLQKARAAGEIADLSDDALEPLIYMLLATRSYLALRYTNEEGMVNLPEEAVAVYLQLLSNGLTRGMDR